MQYVHAPIMCINVFVNIQLETDVNISLFSDSF